MGLFNLFKKSEPYNDPVFGLVDLDPAGFWMGQVEFQGQDVQVLIPGDKSNPSPAARELFQELTSRFIDIRPGITEILFEQYSNYRENTDPEDDPDFPLLDSQEEIWKHTTLDAVNITDSVRQEFELSYSMDWHEDHSFDIQISQWQVECIALNG